MSMGVDPATPAREPWKGLAEEVQALEQDAERIASRVAGILDPTAALPLRRACVYLADAAHLLEVRARGRG